MGRRNTNRYSARQQAQDKTGSNDEHIHHWHGFQAQRIRQIQQQINHHQRKQGSVTPGQPRATGQQQPCQAQARRYRHGPAGQRPHALGRVLRIKLAVKPVIDHIDRAGHAAKSGKRQHHLPSHTDIAPALAENQARKDKAIFKPLVRSGKFEEG